MNKNQLEDHGESLIAKERKRVGVGLTIQSYSKKNIDKRYSAGCVPPQPQRYKNVRKDQILTITKTGLERGLKKLRRLKKKHRQTVFCRMRPSPTAKVQKRKKGPDPDHMRDTRIMTNRPRIMISEKRKKGGGTRVGVTARRGQEWRPIANAELVRRSAFTWSQQKKREEKR
ncbi:hypothetical protein PoB_005657200 [Plakobranchus ocellatus]|uniref:Uncharacterized protein n=1 Tax=Plakobranchus ocellatus TaxID=259542 RepID=A0AAV4CFC6_9GAST|nr:hypothetical protein PoB_005657200 [Plakobranchus ocellatus]